MKTKTVLALAIFGLASVVTQAASAASGEMGTGVPRFGIYSDPVAPHIMVWSLDDASIAFPAGCSSLILHPVTMGLERHAHPLLRSRATR